MLLPSNPLEQSLFNASADEKQTPKFYELLMDSTIFILGSVSGKENETFEVNGDQEFDIQHWERDDDQSPVIPFFTSLQTLQKSIPEDTAYLEMPVTAFFEMTLGVSLIMNPNTDYGIEFEFEDVASLMNIDPNELPEAHDHVYAEDTEMLLGKLDTLPENLCKALVKTLSNYPAIETAYIGAIHIPSEDKEPHLLIGLEGEGDIATAMPSIADSIDTADNDSDYEMFDFYTLSENDPEGISQFLKEENTAFYHASTNNIH